VHHDFEVKINREPFGESKMKKTDKQKYDALKQAVNDYFDQLDIANQQSIDKFTSAVRDGYRDVCKVVKRKPKL
jgi:hypothetical protein